MVNSLFFVARFLQSWFSCVENKFQKFFDFILSIKIAFNFLVFELSPFGNNEEYSVKVMVKIGLDKRYFHAKFQFNGLVLKI